MKTIEYLREAVLLSKEIKEEERRTTKFDVRVIVETKGFGEWDWRRTVLSHHELTLEKRDKVIQALRWLRDI